VLEAIHFTEAVHKADLVITGEGSTDFQTAFGKAPVGVAKVAREAGVPVLCLSGSLGKGCDDVLAHGIMGLMSIIPKPMTLGECINSAAELVREATARLCRLVAVGKSLS